ncbi:60S ribosomal protein L8B [Coelomomyces lativittatus]|nr:60S ribosomal protein L8B [Coelomomyces lativittatus]
MKKKVPLKKVIRKDPRIVARPRNFGIGNAIQPKRDLSRFMKWPVYVRIQRQRAILKRRLKVPPAIHQFSRVLTKNAAMRVFKLLHSLRPETQLAKRRRLRAMAELKLKMKKDPSLTKKAPTKLLKPITVKFGLNHVVSLIEMKKAKLVVIAHDVDPIELIVYLPALCRKMNVPYMIVRSKSRLGTVVHQKKVTALVVTEVKPGQQAELVKLQQLARKYFNDQGEELRKSWGGGKLSLKAKQKVAKKLKEAGGASVLELKKKLIE